MKTVTSISQKIWIAFILFAQFTAANAQSGSLSAPSNLRAVVVNGNSFSLQWQDNSANEMGFKVENVYTRIHMNSSAPHRQIQRCL